MYESSTIQLLVWVVLSSAVNGATIEKMLVSKMQMSDLESSGTGYAYLQQQDLPASYVHYTNHGGRLYYNMPKPGHYVAQPVAHSASSILYPNLNPAAYVYARGLTATLNAGETRPPYFVVNQPTNFEKFQAGDAELNDEDESKAKEDSNESEDFKAGDKWRAIVPHAGHDAAYVNDAGKTYDAAKYSAHGSKGETGYNTRNEFDEGENGAHFEDNHKGYYNDKGGHEKARSETAGHYAQHGEEEKGAKGANYEQVKYHKKGHKTSGFHNVYHKDEYKKDTDFYDEKHESGNFEKYGSNDEHHRNEEGEFKKGLQHDSAHDSKVHANEGSSDKGHSHKHKQGHNYKKGDDGYHSKEAEFAKTSRKQHKKEFNYQDKDGFLD